MKSLKGLRGGIYFVTEIPRSIGGRVLRRRLKHLCERERFMTDSSPTTNNGNLSNSNPKMNLSKRTNSFSFTSFQNFSGNNISVSSQSPRPTINGIKKLQKKESIQNLLAKTTAQIKINKQIIALKK